MLYGYLYCYVILLAGNIYRLIVKGSLVRIHVTHEIYNAALIVIFGLFLLPRSRSSISMKVTPLLRYASSRKRFDIMPKFISSVSNTRLSGRKVILVPTAHAAHLFQGSHWLSGYHLAVRALIAPEGLAVHLAASTYLYFYVFAQRIHNGGAHSMKTP